MIFLLERINAGVERNMKNIEVAFRVYSLIFALCLLVFGFGGVEPLSNALKTKRALLIEMLTDEATMKSNLINLEAAQKDIADNKDGIALLERYMPVGTNAQTYMLDFIQSAGDQGFYVKSFSQTPVEQRTGQMDITLVLEGTTYPARLIKTTETLKRVTQVKKAILYKNSRGEININMVLTIYNYVI